jgi:lipopolysaccharide heptosyltransferase II
MLKTNEECFGFSIQHSAFGIDRQERHERQRVKILLLRLRLIGDVVFTTPLIRALRRAYPTARITYLVEAEAAPIVRHNPHLDEVIVVPRTRGLRRVADDVMLARRLRRERFDLALDLHGGPRSAWFAWASGATTRVGYDITGRAWMYTRLVARSRELTPRHSVVNQWDLLDAIPGWPGGAPGPERDAVEMPLQADADARMAGKLAAAGVGPGDELVTVHVSAGNPFRRWPETSFVETVTALASAHPGRRIVLSSGPSDRGAASRIAEAARARLGAGAGRVVDVGEFDLQELRALIERSRLFVGGDTGPLHIAACTPTAVVGLYGPTLSARSAPWRGPDAVTISLERDDLPCRPCDQRVCAPGDFRCLTGLTPDRVIAAAEQALGGQSRGRIRTR